jgi:hypothetical protein
MNFKEALRAMLEGKKVRRRCWLDGDYICINNIGQVIDEDGVPFNVNELALNEQDFEIFREYELYAPALYKKEDQFIMTTRLFKTEEEARHHIFPQFKETFVKWLIDTHAVKIMEGE